MVNIVDAAMKYRITVKVSSSDKSWYHKGSTIVNQLKEIGLVNDSDFNWRVSTNHNKLEFSFLKKEDAVFFALKWR